MDGNKDPILGGPFAPLSQQADKTPAVPSGSRMSQGQSGAVPASPPLVLPAIRSGPGSS